ncbi:hypothetical protein [Natronococcus jeotgali]|uniref:DUF8159 domain-containing protein n=1 Tax=Natronococcus jeotgali DSM 18795 TaxID=1227498 RepID=L9XXH3_9EURY|nr:hypothetical protein [Natronococcus jeotgali]ELY66212.1 hypothetical protein C492_01488 [Natronococcus jeotgali DSM 18795]
MGSDHAVETALENRLMSNGIYVTDVSWPDGDEAPADGAAIDLEYETVAEAPVVTTDEVSAVVRMLLAVAEERGWTPGRLEVTSLSTDGELRGRWHVEDDWFAGLGVELSEVEFSQRVLETVNRPSEVE